MRATKRDTERASSSNHELRSPVRLAKRRRRSADADWYVALEPVQNQNVNDLWPDALMDNLLSDWLDDMMSRWEKWIKEWSSEEMLATVVSLKFGVSRNNKNRGFKTVLHGTRIPQKCFASRPNLRVAV